MSHNADFYRSQQTYLTQKDADHAKRLAEYRDRADLYAIATFFLAVFMVGFGAGALFTWVIF